MFCVMWYEEWKLSVQLNEILSRLYKERSLRVIREVCEISETKTAALLNNSTFTKTKESQLSLLDPTDVDPN